MLALFFSRINLSTRVGVQSLISKLNKMDLVNYNEDAITMVNDFQATYNEILDKEPKGFSNVESALLDALLTTKNSDLAESVKTIER